ncbi:MAG: AraC family transcriptional regulator, partial [Bacteroidota bacterium]
MNLNNNSSKLNISDEKNNVRGSFQETKIENGFIVLTYNNQSPANQTVKRNIESNFIQFHFCSSGSTDFVFNNGNYRLSLSAENSLLLYNPQRELPIHLEAESHCQLVTILISIKKFHGLFSQEADYITFLSDDNKDKKYYKDGKINPSMSIVLNQMLNYSLNNAIQNLYF